MELESIVIGFLIAAVLFLGWGKISGAVSGLWKGWFGKDDV